MSNVYKLFTYQPNLYVFVRTATTYTNINYNIKTFIDPYENRCNDIKQHKILFTLQKVSNT